MVIMTAVRIRIRKSEPGIRLLTHMAFGGARFRPLYVEKGFGSIRANVLT